MGTEKYARHMATDLRSETDDERHRRLLAALTSRLTRLRSAEAVSGPLPSLPPVEDEDEATREILNDPLMIAGLIEGIEDARAGRELSLGEFREEQRRSPRTGGAVLG